MLFDMRGADFFRLQRANQGRVGDPLDPDVLFSGGYEDGQALFLQTTVDAPGVANSKSYNLYFGRTYARPPMAFASLKLTQGLNQNNTQFFNAGEYLAPCTYRRNIFGQGPVVDYTFYYITYTDRVMVVVAGFTGVVSVMCLEIN